MRNKIIFASAFFMALYASRSATADDVKITTYYPSPYGSYQNLESTGDTYLATDDGNVGIGTKTPTAKLEINGNVRLKDPALPVAAGDVLVDMDGSGLGKWKTPPAKGSLIGSGVTDAFATWTSAFYLVNSPLIEKNGNVGIRSANPLSRVSVGDNGVSNAMLFGSISTVSDKGIEGEGDTYGIYTTGKRFGAHGTAPNFGVYGNEKYTNRGPGLLGDGYYGVYGKGSQYGVSGQSVGYAVHGVDNAASGYGVYGKALGNYGVFCESGACGGRQAWTSASDGRLKTAIQPINDPITRVRALRGVEFLWKDTRKKDIGFIAQEVLKAAPETVEQDPKGYYSMKQSELTALFVEAIKAQQKEIKVLQAKLSAMKNEKTRVQS